jgi:hypothetical protein
MDKKKSNACSLWLWATMRAGIAGLVAFLTIAVLMPSAQAQGGMVVVNGQPLTSAQLMELQSTYGAVIPGCYWYDVRSGLFGHCGRETAGVLRAGHRFAPLREDASYGNTTVFVNGRRLPAVEVMYLRQIFGSVVPGRYWLSGNGDYGFEGGWRLGNLYALARRTSGGPHRVYSPGSLSGLIGAGGNYCSEHGTCVYTNY